jgi:hypothetical protein
MVRSKANNKKEDIHEIELKSIRAYKTVKKKRGEYFNNCPYLLRLSFNVPIVGKIKIIETSVVGCWCYFLK